MGIRYSQNAVICKKKICHPGEEPRDEMCLVVRIANNHIGEGIRDSTVLGVSVTAKVLVTRISVICSDKDPSRFQPYGWVSCDKNVHESELIPLLEWEVKLENAMTLFGTAPIDYYHIINEQSPFYELGKMDLETEDNGYS